MLFLVHLDLHKLTLIASLPAYSFWPTQSITQAGVTGPATVIIQGLGIGMISTVGPVLILVATILGCNALSGEYGIGMYNKCYVLTIALDVMGLLVII